MSFPSRPFSIRKERPWRPRSIPWVTRKYIEVKLSGDDVADVEARVEEMCRRLLANEVIEDYRFDVETA